MPTSSAILTRGLLGCGAVGGLGFIGTAGLVGAFRAGYSPWRHPVSSSSLGPGGWVQKANFIACGLLMLAFSCGMERALGSGAAATWGPALVGVFGFGLIGAGVFDADPGYGYPPGAPAGIPPRASATGMLHNLVSVVAILALAATCLAFARRFSALGNRFWAIYSVASGLSVVLFFFAAALVWARGGPGGIVQRACVGTGWGWIAALAFRLLAVGAP
jgi:hypothetical protein